MFLARHPCPWLSPRPPAPAADGAAGAGGVIGWVVMAREGGKENGEGGSPWIRGPATSPLSPAAGPGGCAIPPPAAGCCSGDGAQNGRGEAGQCPGGAVLQDQRWARGGVGFAGVYSWEAGGIDPGMGRGAAPSPVGCGEARGELDPLPTQPLARPHAVPWPERGQRAAPLRVPCFHSLSLLRSRLAESADTHTHRHSRERFKAASGKSDLILPFRV